MNHCWHPRDNMMMMSSPPKRDCICCHCGESRVQSAAYENYMDGGGHGEFARTTRVLKYYTWRELPSGPCIPPGTMRDTTFEEKLRQVTEAGYLVEFRGIVTAGMHCRVALVSSIDGLNLAEFTWGHDASEALSSAAHRMGFDISQTREVRKL